jgi:hypothetical protein
MGWNCLRAAALIPIALAIGAMSASAATILVTFDNDRPDDGSPGGCIAANGLACPIDGNSFTSDDSSQIHFSDTLIQSPDQGDMFIVKEPFTNDSNALAVAFDDDSALRMVFDLRATSISMDLFVGDNYKPQAGDTAVLTAFLGAVEVGSISVDLTAQQILFDGAGATFDRAELEFVVPGGLAEIVDNVSVALIPEPNAAVVFGAGALLVGVACGRRSRAQVGLRAGRR